MPQVVLTLSPPPGHAYDIESFREQIGQRLAVLVADEGVELAELVDVRPGQHGWDIDLTFNLSEELARRHRAGEVTVVPNPDGTPEAPPGFVPFEGTQLADVQPMPQPDRLMAEIRAPNGQRYDLRPFQQLTGQVVPLLGEDGYHEASVLGVAYKYQDLSTVVIWLQASLSLVERIRTGEASVQLSIARPR
jgi:hypothetical protein